VVAEVREELIELVAAGRSAVLLHGLWMRKEREERSGRTSSRRPEAAHGSCTSPCPGRNCCAASKHVTSRKTATH
jgi:hypothetical protein